MEFHFGVRTLDALHFSEKVLHIIAKVFNTSQFTKNVYRMRNPLFPKALDVWEKLLQLYGVYGILQF